MALHHLFSVGYRLGRSDHKNDCSVRREEAQEFFRSLSPSDQAGLILALSPGEARIWLRLLAPDEAADLIQRVPLEKREALLQLLDDRTVERIRDCLIYDAENLAIEILRTG